MRYIFFVCTCLGIINNTYSSIIFEGHRPFTPSTETCRATISDKGEFREEVANQRSEQIDCMLAGFKNSARFPGIFMDLPAFKTKLPALKNNGFLAVIDSDGNLIIYKPEKQPLINAHCTNKFRNWYISGLLEDYTRKDIKGFYERMQHATSVGVPRSFKKDKRATHALLDRAPIELQPFCIPYEL